MKEQFIGYATQRHTTITKLLRDYIESTLQNENEDGDIIFPAFVDPIIYDKDGFLHDPTIDAQLYAVLAMLQHKVEFVLSEEDCFGSDEPGDTYEWDYGFYENEMPDIATLSKITGKTAETIIKNLNRLCDETKHLTYLYKTEGQGYEFAYEDRGELNWPAEVVVSKKIVNYFIKKQYSSLMIKMYLLLYQLEHLTNREHKKTYRYFNIEFLAHELGLAEIEDEHYMLAQETIQTALNALKNDGLINFEFKPDSESYYLTFIAENAEQFINQNYNNFKNDINNTI